MSLHGSNLLFLIPFTVQHSPFSWFLLSWMTLNRVQAGCPVEDQHPGYARVFPLYSLFLGRPNRVPSYSLGGTVCPNPKNTFQSVPGCATFLMIPKGSSTHYYFVNLMASGHHQPTSKEAINLYGHGAHGGKVEQQIHTSLALNAILRCPHPE